MDYTETVPLLGFVAALIVGGYLSYRLLRNMVLANTHVQARIFTSVALTYAVLVGAWLMRGVVADMGGVHCSGFFGAQELCTQSTLFIAVIFFPILVIGSPIVYLFWLAFWLIADSARKQTASKPKKGKS